MHSREWVCILKLCNYINIMVCIHINIHVDVGSQTGSQIWIENKNTEYLQKECAKKFANAIIIIFYNYTMLTIWKYFHRSIKPQNFPALCDHCNFLKIVETTLNTLLLFSDSNRNTFCYRTPTDCQTLIVLFSALTSVWVLFIM